MTQIPRSFALRGGLNLTTSPIEIPPGHCISARNYEPDQQGYRRWQGHERYDGQPKPSEASYWVLDFDQGSAAISEGDTVTGATSGATGVALIDAVVESGSYGGADAAGYLVLTAVSGTFQDDEDLQVSAVTKSVADGTAVQNGAENDTDATTWQQDAEETARALIGKVTGSGKILGVWVYNGVTYAFRNNAGGTAAVMFKATSSGWSSINLGLTIDFTSGGTYEIQEGDTITGASNGATATVERVIVTSGDWSTSDAAGRLILSGQTGTFIAENLDVGANLNVATVAGDSSAITLPAGGRYEFDNHNFRGHASTERMYGCNGVGTAFEFDGSVFVPIVTGMTTDAPNHIAHHKNHLFLSFPGGSVQHSGIGDPYSWSPVLGAAELGVGDECTGFGNELFGVLAILARNHIKLLYGNDASDWNLVDFAEQSGCVEWTAQKLGGLLVYDDRGVRELSTTQAFGDFRVGTTTLLVDPLIASKKKAGILPVASVRVRAKDLYRVFFSDGTGLSIYFGRKRPEVMPLDLGFEIFAICSSEDANGNEVIFFGKNDTTDGYVYQMDSGNGFDGALLDYFIRQPFFHAGSPSYDKRWHKIVIEADIGTDASLVISAETDFAHPDAVPLQEESLSVMGGGGFWGEANWDEFYWSAQVVGVAEAHVDAYGANISVSLAGETIYEPPHTLHSITYHFSPRKMRR